MQGAAAAQPERELVLIVEDDPDAREMIRELLTDRGYDTEEAENGREALEKLHERRPKVVLLDVMMPDMDGWEFCDAKRRDPTVSDVPVVVMSGYHRGEVVARAIGAQAFLRKPIAVSDLLRAVEGNGG